MSETYLSRGEGLAARSLGGETVVMVMDASRLLSLNETASLLFHAADGVTPLRRIVEQKICGEFDVSFDQAYQDALGCAEALAHEGVLRLSEAPAS